MRDRDHDTSLLVPLLNVLESFRDPLQRIGSVDDRPEVPSRDEFCDETHSLQIVDSHPALDLLSASDGGPKDPNDVGQLHDVLKEDTVGLQRVFAAVKRRRADDIEYQIVGFAILGEIVPCVVDHRGGTPESSPTPRSRRCSLRPPSRQSVWPAALRPSRWPPKLR